MYFCEEAIEVMEEYLYLAPSKIHGTGVFAKKDIPKDTEIGYYRGPAWNGTGTDTYVYWSEQELAILVVGPMRFMNHSPECNAETYEWVDSPYHHNGCTVVAIRDIRKGEEITSNYGESFQEWLDSGMPEDEEYEYEYECDEGEEDGS
jgi:SET domain-containing protein